MSFRRYSKKPIARVHRVSTRHSDPADFRVRVYRPKKLKVVNEFFNSFYISDHYIFTLRKFGRLFNYHGVLTKQYDMPTMERLFHVERRTIYRWIQNEYLPEPIIRVVGRTTRVYWFYHQVQPFYVWYWYRKARGLSITYPPAPELKKLKRLHKLAERQWYIRLELPYNDPYERVAGRYGVIYPEED